MVREKLCAWGSSEHSALQGGSTPNTSNKPLPLCLSHWHSITKAGGKGSNCPCPSFLFPPTTPTPSPVSAALHSPQFCPHLSFLLQALAEVTITTLPGDLHRCPHCSTSFCLAPLRPLPSPSWLCILHDLSKGNRNP